MPKFKVKLVRGIREWVSAEESFDLIVSAPSLEDLHEKKEKLSNLLLEDTFYSDSFQWNRQDEYYDDAEVTDIFVEDIEEVDEKKVVELEYEEFENYD